MKRWLRNHWGELCGLAAAVLLLICGKWFSVESGWLDWRSVEARREFAGRNVSPGELWDLCCPPPPTIPGGATAVPLQSNLWDTWTERIPCVAGRGGENLILAVQILATGFFLGGIFMMLAARHGPWRQGFHWCATAIAGISWAGLLVAGAGHNVTLAGFYLFAVLLMSALLRTGRARRDVTSADG